MSITETVLEMHFHRPLMDAIRETLGLGPNGSLNFYKYSTRRECFVGIDQAYAISELSEAEFFNLLKKAASSSSSILGEQFFGYFLQFKVVKEMVRFNRYTPPMITSRPHYRASLDTKRNANTGLSQHELLFNLNTNKGALVYYACPMVFDKAALYEVEVDLDTLQLADLGDCRSPYTDNENHYIYFNDPTSNPVWCSDPVEGKSMSSRDFISLQIEREASPNRRVESSQELLDILTDYESTGLDREAKAFADMPEPSLLSLLSESLTVVRLDRAKSSN